MKFNIGLFGIITLFLWFEQSALVAQTVTFVDKNNSENVEERIEVVFSVDPRKNKITKIYIQEESTEQQLYQLKQDCYRCSYFTGNLYGTFAIRKNYIVPLKGATLTINTGKDLMTAEEFKPGTNFRPGSVFPLAGIKTTVVSNLPGVMVLKGN